MTVPSDLERSFWFMRAFELAFLTDGWPGLLPFLHEDARHVVHGGGILGGTDDRAEAVVEGLRQSVHRIDRRFDVRIPEVIEGPCSRPDGIWMRFSLGLRRAGLPELRVEGEHLISYADGRIQCIDEHLTPGTDVRVAAYLAAHGAALRPEGSAPAPVPDGADRRDLDAALGRTLVRCYGTAKSEQDAGAALAVCGEGFSLETVSLGLASQDRKETAQHLAVFFRAFPDYCVSLDGFAAGDGVTTCWGSARMSLHGELFGIAPTGKTAELPIFCVFPHANGALEGERFFFDLATLCEQLGVPVAAMTAALRPLRLAQRSRHD